MSDTSAPSPPPPPSNTPAPAPQQEVPVNQNPVDVPRPLGDQAPPAAPEKPPVSRREAIQKALAKQRVDSPPQPREAKKGDNNPPEDTPDEEFSLKKRPSDQPRDRGRFAPKSAPNVSPQESADAGRQAAQPGTQAAPQPYTPPPGAPAHHHPIPRMSPRAAALWDKVPDEVRADAHRMYREIDQAFRKYKADYDFANTIRPYIEMARQQGTTIARVLENHDGIEQKLRSDPIGGLEIIVHNLNLQTPDGQKLTFRDLAWHHLNQTPEQHQLIQQRNSAEAMRLQIEEMRRQQEALANEHRRMQYAQHFSMTRGAVDRYADTHPRFNELGPLIHQEIQLGFDLETAYRRAELLWPATAAQTRTGTTAAQTRNPDRSISGAPGGGPLNGAARTGKPTSRKDAIAHAINHVRGSL